MKDKINDIVIQCVEKILQLENINFDKLQNDFPLFGKQGVLDSLSLITLIGLLEHEFLEETGKQLQFDEGNIFLGVENPFKTICTLSNYLNNTLGLSPDT